MKQNYFSTRMKWHMSKNAFFSSRMTKCPVSTQSGEIPDFTLAHEELPHLFGLFKNGFSLSFHFV